MRNTTAKQHNEASTPFHLLVLQEFLQDGKVMAALRNARNLQRQIDRQAGTDEAYNLHQVILFLRQLPEMPL